jgi:hypothetical protein
VGWTEARVGDGGAAERAGTLADRLADRLPALSITATSRDPVRRLVFSMAKGQATLALRVIDEVGRYRLLVPDRPDVSADRLAAAVAVFSAVRRRFPDVPTPDLSFEETVSTEQRRVSGLGGDRRVRVDHELVLEGTTPPVRRWLELVVAHECWHTIEIARYRDTFELRRALGEELGLPTFEAAFVAMPGVAPEQRAAARARIREAVGTYATTKAIEGTAELFAHWWVGASTHPLVAAFGRLVDRYLPPPAAGGPAPPVSP